MIAIELIIAAFFIGKIYQLKPVNEFPRWITIFGAVTLILTNTAGYVRDIRKVEALEKIVVEISKSKPEEK